VWSEYTAYACEEMSNLKHCLREERTQIQCSDPNPNPNPNWRKGHRSNVLRKQECAYRMLQLALECGASVHTKDHNNMYPIHDAVIERSNSAFVPTLTLALTLTLTVGLIRRWLFY